MFRLLYIGEPSTQSGRVMRGGGNPSSRNSSNPSIATYLHEKMIPIVKYIFQNYTITVLTFQESFKTAVSEARVQGV